MRLIHTADIHLDASFASPGMPPGYGNRRRQDLRDALRRVMRRAKEWPADAVLIAGDLFDLDRVRPDSVAFVQAEFEALESIPVFITPGNHDPYTRFSPYATESWPGNVVIFKEPDWKSYELQAVPLTVHGFAFDGFDISSNPFGHLQIPRDGRVHIAVGHGSEMGTVPPDLGGYAPFTAANAAAERLRYLALGHYHQMKEIQAPFGTRMWYPGPPEGHDFNELGPRHSLEVTIEDDSVSVEPVPSARCIYEVHELDCSAFQNSQEVIDRIRSLAESNGNPQIARIVLSGTGADAWRGEIGAILDAVSPDFEYLDFVNRLEPPVDYDALGREETSLGAFVRQMNDAILLAGEERERRKLLRAREVGLAAYRNAPLPIEGAGGE